MTSTISPATATRWSTPTARVDVPIDAPRERWLAARTTGVTATDIRVLAGHGYQGETVFARFLDKTEPADPQGEDVEITPRAWDLGLAEEPVIRHFAQLDLGIELRRVGMLRHRDVPHLIASPDCNCACGGHAELKDTNSWFLKTYQDEAADYTNTDGWTLPPSWRVQVLHQLTVSGRDHVHVCAKIADRKTFTYWLVERDQLEQDMLRELADMFWDHVQAGEAPPIEWDTVTAAEVKARYPRVVIDRVLADDVAEVLQLIADREELKYAIKVHDSALTRIETRLKAIAATAGEVVDTEGRVLFAYPDRTRRGVDTKRLFAEHPEIDPAAYETVTRFRQLAKFTAVA